MSSYRDIRAETLDEANAIIRTLVLHIEKLEEQVRVLLRHRFASKNEKNLLPEGYKQLSIFGDPEDEAEQEPIQQIEVSTHRRCRPKRKPLPKELPRVEIIHDIDEEDKQCRCGATLSKIGEETSEKLDIVPTRIRVIRHVRYKYACRQCEGVEDQGPTVKIASPPAEILPKAMATGGTLSAIIIAKFADGLPLYRQEKMFHRMGVEISRSTMADWLIKIARKLQPLIDESQQLLLCGPVVNADETPVQVLKEPGRANTTKSYMWVFRGGDPHKPVVLFHYSPTRSGEVAREILQGYQGYCQTDGFSGYDALESVNPGIRLVGCFAHVRRAFAKAIDARPKSARKKTGSAEVALGYIQQLYGIERRGRALELSIEQFCEYRKKRAGPVLDKFKQWLLRRGPQTPPRVYLGKAIRYTLKRWDKLVRYLEDGHLTPDNNAAENAIRPFALGRKNWLFAGHPNGAHAAATYFTLIETAKACGLEPYRYLRFLLERFPHARGDDDYACLLPPNVSQQDPAPYAHSQCMTSVWSQSV